MIKLNFKIFIIICLLFFISISNAQIKISGKSYSEAAIADSSDSEFTESWNELNINWNAFRLGFSVSVHEPAAQFGDQHDVWGLEQRFIEYKNNNFSICLGNFYSLLGRGLTMRSFENRTLRWDSNLDGTKINYNHDFFDIQLLAGKPRRTRLDVNKLNKKDPPAAGEKLPAQYGGEIKLNAIANTQIGGTYVYAEADELNDTGFHRGSVFGEVNLDLGSLYAEYAAIPYPGSYNQDNGKALYLSGNLFLDDLSILGEYKYYKNFGFYNGLLNNPPTVIFEHLFTLLNRHQLVQDVNNEKGYLIELSYPVLEDGVAKAGFCQTNNHQGEKVYRDVYGQFEMEEFFGGEWLWAAGYQTESTSNYLNLVTSANYGLSDYYSIKLVYEHLAARDEGTEPDRQYYDQLITIGLSKAPDWTLSFIGEHSTDHTVAKNYVPGKAKTKHFLWAGGQLDISLFNHIDLSIFGGTRQKGKICIGGVCVNRPELKGVEVTLTARF